MDYDPLFAETVPVATKAHARRAITWLRNRSMLSFYRPADKSLVAYVTKDGRTATFAALNRAVEATRKGTKPCSTS